MATQRIDLIGYIGKDAELRTTPNGKSVADFSLATTDRYNDVTTWWKVTVWGKLAEAVTQYLTKVTQVHVGGTMTNPQGQTYVNSAGEIVVENYAITARDLDLLGSAAERPGKADGQQGEAAPPGATAAVADERASEGSQIPF